MANVMEKKSLHAANVIKLRCKAKNQEKEQVIEKIARSFLHEKRKYDLTSR